MQILHMAAFEGRNVHSHYPVVEMKVALGKYQETTTRGVPGFNDRLLGVLPSLREHYCSLGRPGGFVERLKEGTYLGHVLEHVVLELQTLAGMDVIYGKTRMTSEPGVYKVVFEYRAKQAGLLAGRLALELILGLIDGCPVDVDDVIAKLKRIAEETEPGPSTAAIIRAAERRGIPHFRVNEGSLVQLGYGCRQKRVQATITAATGCIAADIAGDKTLTKKILAEAGIPVPYGGVAANAEEALALAEEIGTPVVLKPYNGNQGKGVSLNLSSEAEIRAAFEVAWNYASRVIVEKYIRGRHYRILVVGDKVVAASERIPAYVTGDGTHSIRELIDLVNRDPMRGEGHEKPLTRIKVDPVVLLVLARQGLTLDYTPGMGEVVYLRENANLSTGGIAIDATDDLHPENIALARRVARVIGLDVAGVDVVVEDLGLPIVSTGGAVIEVNAAPGIRMHHYPSKGRPRDVAGAIVDMLFPPGAPSRIPLIAVTGTNGKTTTTRMVGHILATAGYRVGMTTTDGIYIGGECVFPGDTTGPRSARTVLHDPTVEAAVLETARGGIIWGGLAFDQCDVGVVTNVTEDHLGQDGVETLEDLADVKSLVVESVSDRGYAVLNADDPMAVAMTRRARCRVIYYTSGEDNLVVHKHLAEGGRAVLVKNGVLTLAQGHQETRLLPVKSIPVTLHGGAIHNIQNAAAAAAAAFALDIPADAIRPALRTFGNSIQQNPGRLNILTAGDFRVVLDYGHNPAGFEATIRAVRHLNPARLIGVVGLPGDRRDEAAEKLGAISGKAFDYCVIKEDHDLRGREPGQVAALMLKGALSTGADPDRFEIVLSETDAIKAAMDQARTGDIVVIFYEKLDQALRAVEEKAGELKPATRRQAELAVVGAAGNSAG